MFAPKAILFGDNEQLAAILLSSLYVSIFLQQEKLMNAFNIRRLITDPRLTLLWRLENQIFEDDKDFFQKEISFQLHTQYRMNRQLAKLANTYYDPEMQTVDEIAKRTLKSVHFY
jgi:hypothetical protein